jgi:hypothetical protein
VITAFVVGLLANCSALLSSCCFKSCISRHVLGRSASYRIASRTPPSRNWSSSRKTVRCLRSKIPWYQGIFPNWFCHYHIEAYWKSSLKSMLMPDLPVSSRLLIRRFCFQALQAVSQVLGRYLYPELFDSTFSP